MRVLRPSSVLLVLVVMSACGREPHREVGPLLTGPDSGGTIRRHATPNAVFRTTPAANEDGVIVGPGPLEVEFNLCQSRPADESDELKYTYDWDANGTVDWYGHCRKTQRFEFTIDVDVCVSDRRPDNAVCRRYHVRPGPSEQAPSVTPPRRPCGGAGGQCLVFITSTLYGGDLGGLAGADALCQARANAAQLGGRYRAWLSAGPSSPATRFSRSAGQYVLHDGTVIANGWSDLTDGALASPISVDEFGGRHFFFAAFTNTRTNGTEGGYLGSGADCVGWTSSELFRNVNAGTDAYPGTNFWTEGAYTGCYTGNARLYCFEQE